MAGDLAGTVHPAGGGPFLPSGSSMKTNSAFSACAYHCPSLNLACSSCPACFMADATRGVGALTLPHGRICADLDAKPLHSTIPSRRHRGRGAPPSDESLSRQRHNPAPADQAHPEEPHQRGRGSHHGTGHRAVPAMPAPPPPAKRSWQREGGCPDAPSDRCREAEPSGLPAVEARRELRRGRDPHSRTETRRRRQNG